MKWTIPECPSLRSIIDQTIGEEFIVQFREDFKRLIYENNEKFNRWTESNPTLKKQAFDGLNEAQSNRWNKWAVWIGFLGILLGWLGWVTTAVSILSVIFTFVGGLHKLTVDILAFDRPYREHRNNRLKFMSAWNRGVMTSWKAVLILPLGVFIRYTPGAYKIGIWYLDDMMAEQY